MRKISLAVILLLFPFMLFASSGWYLGIESGYSYSIVDSDTGWPNTYILNSHGFDVSVPVEYKVNDWFSINTGVRWIMKSSGYQKMQTNGSYVDNLTKMHHFLEFPLSLRFSAGNDFARCFIGFGGYIGVRTMDFTGGITESESVRNNYIAYAYQQIPFTASDNLFDAGIIAETGLTISVERTGYFYTLIRYQYGLTSLEKNHMGAVHTYFSNLSADIGFMFSLGGQR